MNYFGEMGFEMSESSIHYGKFSGRMSLRISEKEPSSSLVYYIQLQLLRNTSTTQSHPNSGGPDSKTVVCIQCSTGRSSLQKMQPILDCSIKAKKCLLLLLRWSRNIEVHQCFRDRHQEPIMGYEDMAVVRIEQQQSSSGTSTQETCIQMYARRAKRRTTANCFPGTLQVEFSSRRNAKRPMNKYHVMHSLDNVYTFSVTVESSFLCLLCTRASSYFNPVI